MSVRSHSIPSPNRSVPGPIAPEWSFTAAHWLKDQSFVWRFIGTLLGLIFLSFGFCMLVFGGYTSIQGVRIPAAFVFSYWNITIQTDGVPSLLWWIIPLLNNFVQIFVKIIPGLKVFWKPSVIFDSLTTAVFLSFGLLDATVRLSGTGLTAIVIASFLSAFAGLVLTVLSEKLFLGAFPIIGTLFAPYH